MIKEDPEFVLMIKNIDIYAPGNYRTCFAGSSGRAFSPHCPLSHKLFLFGRVFKLNPEKEIEQTQQTHPVNYLNI